jgi:hypothetical protein
VSADGRWTGGAANREWQRGARPAGAPLERAYVAGQIRAYLADCHAAGAILNPRYHPTPEGALEMIPHHGKVQQEQIRREYQRGYTVA